MHVATWHRRTPESKFTKFGEEISIGQTPKALTMRNFVAIQQEVSEIFVIENLCPSPKKVGQTSPKSLKNCYPLNHAKFHRDR